MNKFPGYPKTPRFNLGCLVTEKIDGTNALIQIEDAQGKGQPEDFIVRAGSRKRWITPEKDNFGFAKFVASNEQWLAENLGPGLHYGEWYGQGIQRGYDLDHKRLALFDGPGRYPVFVDDTYTHMAGIEDQDGPLPTRYVDLEGGKIGVVPLLYQGSLEEVLDVIGSPVEVGMRFLSDGSLAAPGYQNTEGVIVQLRGSGGGQRFKVVWGKE